MSHLLDRLVRLLVKATFLVILVIIHLPTARSLEPNAGSSSDKFVFAHYMVCCPLAGPKATVEDYESEIRSAQAAGIDGFALNVGGWKEHSPEYKQRVLNIYAAATKLDSNFKLFISADGAAQSELEDIFESTRELPNQFKVRGRPVISTYGSGPNNIRAKSMIAFAKRHDVFFVPHFFPTPASESITEAQANQLVQNYKDIDGFFWFGGAGTGEQITRANRLLGDRWISAGKIYMASVTPYYRGWGKNFRLFETNGFQAMESEWKTAIDIKAQWVEIVTWNDWGESSYVAPIGSASDAAPWKGNWGSKLLSHDGYLTASAYYIKWFKTGQPPLIDHDSINYFYRLSESSSGSRNIFKDLGGPKGFPSISNKVYVTVFLKKPAIVTITSGPRSQSFDLPGGVSDIQTQSQSGKQMFSITRDNKTILQKNGEEDILPDDEASRFNYFSGFASGARNP